MGIYFSLTNVNARNAFMVSYFALTVSENATSLQEMLQSFKKVNAAWVRMSIMMIDKDLTERKTLSEEFPDAALNCVCFTHCAHLSASSPWRNGSQVWYS